MNSIFDVVKLIMIHSSSTNLKIAALNVSCLILIAFASLSGYLAYFYTLLIFCVFNFACEKNHRKKNFEYFSFFLFIAIVIYFVQKMILPNYMGLTGPEGGVGTDDVRYYAGLGTKIKYTILRTDIAANNPYSPLIRFLYLPKICDPIDIVIFNILGIAFIPYLTYRTAILFLHDLNIALTAERLILFCPFMMSNGLIIMRDVVCTSLILVSLLCFAKKHYLFFFCYAGLLAYLKFGFVVFLFVILIAYLIMQEHHKSYSRYFSILKYSILGLISILIFFIYIFPNLSSITGGRLSPETIFRESYLDFLTAVNEDSFFAKIYSLPIVLRIPILIASFLVVPPLSLDFILDGTFSVRAFLQKVLAPAYWCILYYFFFIFLFSYRKLEIGAKTILYISILLALSLGVISLQFRHKVVLIPFIYIAIAYSMNRRRLKMKPLAFLCYASFLIAQIAYCYTHM